MAGSKINNPAVIPSLMNLAFKKFADGNATSPSGNKVSFSDACSKEKDGTYEQSVAITVLVNMAAEERAVQPYRPNDSTAVKEQILTAAESVLEGDCQDADSITNKRTAFRTLVKASTDENISAHMRERCLSAIAKKSDYVRDSNPPDFKEMIVVYSDTDDKLRGKLLDRFKSLERGDPDILIPLVRARTSESDSTQSDSISELLRVLNERSLFRYMNLQNMVLDGLNMTGLDMSHSNMSGATAIGTIFDHANLHGANLHGANLENGNFSHANMSDATAIGTIFDLANLDSANLENGNFSDASFYFAHAENINEEGAVFTRAKFLNTINQPRPSNL